MGAVKRGTVVLAVTAALASCSGVRLVPPYYDDCMWVLRVLTSAVAEWDDRIMAVLGRLPPESRAALLDDLASDHDRRCMKLGRAPGGKIFAEMRRTLEAEGYR